MSKKKWPNQIITTKGYKSKKFEWQVFRDLPKKEKMKFTFQSGVEFRDARGSRREESYRGIKPHFIGTDEIGNLVYLANGKLYAYPPHFTFESIMKYINADIDGTKD